MASRRRRGIRFRGRSGPRLKWVSGVFGPQTIDPDPAVVTEFHLVEQADWQDTGGTAVITQPCIIRRCIGNFILQLQPFAEATADVRVVWMVHVKDQEDTTGGSLITSLVGTVLQSHRVLQTGIVGVLSRLSTASPDILVPSLNINFDWKGGCRIEPDELLVLAMQYVTDQSGVLNISSASGISRALCRVT